MTLNSEFAGTPPSRAINNTTRVKVLQQPFLRPAPTVTEAHQATEITENTTTVYHVKLLYLV